MGAAIKTAQPPPRITLQAPELADIGKYLPESPVSL